MFNDKYGLTKAVLEGRKTMTRRIVKHPEEVLLNYHGYLQTEKYRYQVGEVVAVAQSYKDAGLEDKYVIRQDIKGYSSWMDIDANCTSGWGNKMFVKADLMPHQIRITNVRVERLQDISDEDCLNEGVFLGQFHTYSYAGRPRCPFNTPRDAFASLINRISGKGTWESNPWVFVYEFELVEK